MCSCLFSLTSSVFFPFVLICLRDYFWIRFTILIKQNINNNENILRRPCWKDHIENTSMWQISYHHQHVYVKYFFLTNNLFILKKQHIFFNLYNKISLSKYNLVIQCVGNFNRRQQRQRLCLCPYLLRGKSQTCLWSKSMSPNP